MTEKDNGDLVRCCDGAPQAYNVARRPCAVCNAVPIFCRKSVRSQRFLIVVYAGINGAGRRATTSR